MGRRSEEVVAGGENMVSDVFGGERGVGVGGDGGGGVGWDEEGGVSAHGDDPVSVGSAIGAMPEVPRCARSC